MSGINLTASQKVQLLRCAASFVTSKGKCLKCLKCAKVPKVNVNAFGVVNLKFAACECGAGLTAQGLGKLELGLLTLCLRPYALGLLFMPHSSRFACLAYGAFYFAVHLMTFYEFILVTT